MKLRFISYNVEYGHRAAPEEIGRILAEWEPDVVCFNEVPADGWSARAGKSAGLEYVSLGKVSSANHRNKYKSILSRTPMVEKKEFVFKGEGWNPASAVRAIMEIGSLRIAVYSLHISSSTDIPNKSHSSNLAFEVLPRETAERIVLMGDFNSKIGDPFMNFYRDAGFSNAWEAAGINVKNKFTCFFKDNEGNLIFDANKNYGVIDHILFNLPEYTHILSAGIIEIKKPLSDHKPIWADIEFKSMKNF